MTFSVDQDKTKGMTRHSSSDVTVQDENNPLLSRAKLSTRLAFFIGGFGIASWAPMVPFAQQRLQADSSLLGSILLCLGLGALVGMPACGGLVARKGPGVAVISGAIGLIISLPLLASVASPWAMALSLLLLGASVGAVDVAANIHGTEVQSAAGTPLMSGFHGLYSIGGLCGASGMTLAIAAGLSVTMAACIASGLILIAVILAASGFLTITTDVHHPVIVIPRGIVITIGLLLFAIFMAEGAILDWGGILLTQIKGVDVSLSGAGYTIFALALTVSRLVGDMLVARLSSRIVLIAGIFLTAIGIIVATIATQFVAIFGGIAIAGLAAGNVVPILLTLSGQQKTMPATVAIAATSTLGYMGILMGPALIGYISHYIGLEFCLILLGVLTFLTIFMVPSVYASLNKE
ncbi:MFS transporter [Citrobacter sp. wls827]|uniref:MFS transporter n=1 Tax=Citrobacter sp. wls827 TaxID=2576414 RepID=UPI0010C9BE64|nr:MFS transporter [Citrobacter sp. wls827]TKU15375.1 MFS transporter [Citrobacter sp. wls827]